MNIANLHRKLKQILEDSNTALVDKGLNPVNSLAEILLEIDDKTLNRLPYLVSRKIYKISESDWHGITSIGSSAFRDCTNLTSITISDSVTSIGDMAFYNCTNLTSVTIPDSVTSIGTSAFNGCTSLTSITIPDSVISIGEYTFYNCTNLTSITISDSITSINSSAFSQCTNLTSVTIPDNVTSIGTNAFRDCTRLTIVIIGNGITNIDDLAFYNCKNLTDMYCNSIIPPYLNKTSAIPSNSNLTIHVPVGSGEAYKSATNWSRYANKIVEDIAVENTTE